MSGQSIREICNYSQEVYNSMDLEDFKGYFYDSYDDVVRFLSLNKKLFTRKGVDFSDSMFIPILIELSSYNKARRCLDE